VQNIEMRVYICYAFGMSLKALKQAIGELSEQDFKTFAAWFDDLRAEVWDKQIKADVQGGKLNQLAEQALSDFRKGKFTKS
jgi:hypothetical protein